MFPIPRKHDLMWGFQTLPAVRFFEEITPLDPCMLFIYNYICWIVYWIWVNIHGWYGHDFQNMHLFTVQKLKTHGWYNQPTSICIHSWLGCPTWSTPHFRRPCLQSQIHPVSWFRQLIHVSLTKNTQTHLIPRNSGRITNSKQNKSAYPKHPVLPRETNGASGIILRSKYRASGGIWMSRDIDFMDFYWMISAEEESIYFTRWAPTSPKWSYNYIYELI